MFKWLESQIKQEKQQKTLNPKAVHALDETQIINKAFTVC